MIQSPWEPLKQNIDEETSVLCAVKAAREKVEDEQGSRLANEDREDGLQDHNSKQKKRKMSRVADLQMKT